MILATVEEATTALVAIEVPLGSMEADPVTTAVERAAVALTAPEVEHLQKKKR